MKVWRMGILGAALVLLLAGCKSFGLGGKRIDYGAEAGQVPALEVPPDLTAPASDNRYRVPQESGEGVASYSDYRRGGAVGTGGRSTVLPEVKGVRLERSGAQRWLVVNDKPENVWLVIKAFLQENGLAIKSEDQAAGVMETDWMENRAKIPQDGVRNVIGKVFDNAYSSGERDQYRVRLERGKDGVSTEVYITHRGMEEVLSDDKSTSKWQARPADPEMEAVMLQRLMARFGGEAQAAPASVPSGTAALRQASDGSSIMVVNDAFDRSWRRVGLAIERAGFAVEDRDRTKGIYFLSPPKAESGWVDRLQFWKDSKGANTRYRVNIRDGGAICEVTVTDLNGASDVASRQILEAIYKNIDQGGAGATPVSVIKTTGPIGTVSLEEVFDGSRVIVVNDAFERSWQKVGLAIERAGLAVENNDRTMGVYYLRPVKAESSWFEKLQFWNSSESLNTRYRVNVKDGGRACEVSVTDQNGVSDDAAKQMIEAIYKNITQ